MAIIRHSFKSEPMTALPFVADIEGHISYWHVPPAADYVEACDVGKQYACDFIEYLKNNADIVGSGFTASIYRDMARVSKDTAAKGYAVGFACVLERALYLVATNTDYYRYEQKVEAGRRRPCASWDTASQNGSARRNGRIEAIH